MDELLGLKHSKAGAGLPVILQVDGATRRFGDVVAVDRLHLELVRGEFVTLLGPSGCGKTTALRLIAGFERPDEGHIHFDDTDVTRWSPQRRGFGMVFQNYALFPHLNVFENVAFGLRSRKQPAEEIRRRVRAALERVDLDGYQERAVQALSGGQQQRVALARALAIEPALLLLDEPLSNLDHALRVRTRAELRALVKELGITALFVTHDQEEAFDLSDRVAVMHDGRIRQIGSPRALYEEPVDRFVASFMGRVNSLSVTVLEGERGEGAADSLGPRRPVRLRNGARWLGPARERESGAERAEAGTDGLLLIRPEDLAFRDEGERTLEGIVRDRRFRGALTLYQVEVEGIGPQGGPELLELAGGAGGPSEGDRVRIGPHPEARLHLFPARQVGA